MGKQQELLVIWTTSLLLAPACLLWGQIPEVKAPGFSQELQTTAVTATVQIWNLTQKAEGSGVLIGTSAPFVYVLTAQHVVRGADRLEVAVFSKGSFPKPKAVYRSAAIVSETSGLADLALLRLTTTDIMPSYLGVCPEEKIPSAGEMRMLSVGCDDGKAPTCSPETVPGKKLARRPEGKETAFFWEVDRKQVPGRSGGPLIDGRGYLLGVCSGSNREKTYFTHVEEIHSFLKMHGFRWLIEAKASP